MSPQVLRRIALALLVAVLVWGALVLYGRTGRDEAGALALPRLTTARVSEIAIRKAKDTLLLARQGTDWTVNGFRAHAPTVETFINALGDSTAKSEIVAQSRSSHERLGVDSVSAKRLTITADGKPAVDLWLGNRGPDFEGFYVRPAGSDIVYLLRGHFAELTVQGVPEWREKQIAALAADSVGRVEVTRGKSRWVLSRNGTGWSLGKGNADSAKVTRFLAQFATLRAEGFPEPEELDSIRFDKPARTLTVSSRSGSPLLGLVFDSTHAGSFWVRAAAGGPVYRFDPRTAELVTPADSTFNKK
jgi:hypothetical protein